LPFTEIRFPGLTGFGISSEMSIGTTGNRSAGSPSQTSVKAPL